MVMRTVLFLVLLCGFAACKNNDASTASPKDTAAAVNVSLRNDSAGRVAQLSFIDGCMENSRLTLGEPKAFAFCKCMYEQIEAKYPNLDSAGIANLDTATVARLAASCR